MTPQARLRLLILLAFLSFVSLGLPDGVLGVAWPFIRSTFELPISRLGIFLVFGAAGYLISSFFAGQLVQRMGVGRVLLFSTVLVVAALCAYAITPRWAFLLPAALCVGLGSGAIDAAINVFAASTFSARVVTWLHAFYGVGATLGPAIMTAAIAFGYGWRWGYGSLAVILGVMAVGFALTLPMWRVQIADTAATETPPTLRDALRHEVVLLHILFFFIYAGAEVTAGQWLFSLLLESRSVDSTTAGAAVTTYWAALTVGRIFFGQAAASFKPMAILRFATLLAPLGAGLLCIRAGAPLAIASAALLGFALAPIFPILISITPERVGTRFSAQAIGFQVSAATVGIATLPSISGVLARNIGLEAIPPFLLAVTVSLLVLNEWIAKRAKERVEEVAMVAA